MPCPPPTQSVARPRRPSRSCSALIRVPTSRTPVAPNGWPMRDRPPVHVHSLRVAPSWRTTGTTCAANASFSSMRSMSADRRGRGGASSFWVAATGPRPMISGESALARRSEDAGERSQAELARPATRS